MNVSVQILTFNEERNLPSCLSALRGIGDIVIVDSGSTDRTITIAEEHGARVLMRTFDNFANQRNFGLDIGAFRHDWVLHLDADEIVTDTFLTALERLVVEPGIDAYYIPSKLMLFGKWLRRSAMYPVYQVRLGHRDRLRFRQVGHGQRENLPAERVGVFPEPYLHYSFSGGMHRWLAKHVGYAAAEVRAIRSAKGASTFADESASAWGVTRRHRQRKELFARLPFALRPIVRFGYVYIWRLGFLEGRAGFVYALSLTTYEAMIAIIGYDRGQSAEK